MTLYEIDWLSIPIDQTNEPDFLLAEKYGKPLKRGEGNRLIKFARSMPDVRFVREPGTLAGGYWTNQSGDLCYHIF